MTDVLREFERLLRRGAAAERGSSIHHLLALMPAPSAAELRRCAIPHEFHPALLRIMSPELDEGMAASRYEEFAQLSCVIAAPDGLALHDAVRAELFAEWLKPDRREEFLAVSARLVMHFSRLAESGNAAALEATLHRRMFHLLATDEPLGFAEFENLCRRARHERRLAACASLVRLVHEYDPVLAPSRAAWLKYHEAKLAFDLGEWEHAEQMFQALLGRDGAEPALTLKARLRLGDLAVVGRDFDRAIERYRGALELTHQTGNGGAKGYDILRSLGEAYRDRGDLHRAEQLLTKSLGDAEQARDEGAIADTCNSLGTLHWKRNDIVEATQAYQTSLDYLLRLGRTFQSAQVYNNLGMIRAEQGAWLEAEQAYQKSLEIKRQAGDTLGQARTLLNLAQLHRSRGQLGIAVETCQEAAVLFEQIRHVPGLAATKHTLGRLRLALRTPEEARRELSEAADLFARLGDQIKANTIRRDIAAIERHESIPWWAWISIGLVGLFVVALIVIIVLAVAGIL